MTSIMRLRYARGQSGGAGDTFAYVPGATADVKLTAINRSHLPMMLSGIHVAAGETTMPHVKIARWHTTAKQQ